MANGWPVAGWLGGWVGGVGGRVVSVVLWFCGWVVICMVWYVWEAFQFHLEWWAWWGLLHAHVCGCSVAASGAVWSPDSVS